MKSAIRLSSATYRIGIRSSANLCKSSYSCSTKPSALQNNYLSKPITGCENKSYKNFSDTRQESGNNDSKNANSPAWYIDEGGNFKYGVAAAGAATALVVSSLLYYKHKKGVKAEGNGYSIIDIVLRMEFYRQKTPKHNKMNYYSISEVKQVEPPKHDLLPIIGKRKEKLPEFTRDQVKMLHYLPTGSVRFYRLR